MTTTIQLPGSIKAYADLDPALVEALQYNIDRQAAEEMDYDPDPEPDEDDNMAYNYYDSDDELEDEDEYEDTRTDAKKKMSKAEEEDDEEEDAEDGGSDEDEEDKMPAFLKKRMKKDSVETLLYEAYKRIDSLEGELSIARTMLDRADSADEPEKDHTDSNLEGAVQDRLDSIFAAYEDAKEFLPTDFKLDGKCTPTSIRQAAIANFDSDSEFKLDSEDAIEGAYAAMKRWGNRRDSSGLLQQAAIASAFSGGDVTRMDMDDAKNSYRNAWKRQGAKVNAN